MLTPAGVSYAALANRTIAKIMRITAPFASNPRTKENLIRIHSDRRTGNWRDSAAGLANGSIPYDVNTALVPASLGAIASLIEARFFDNTDDWKKKALRYVRVSG